MNIPDYLQPGKTTRSNNTTYYITKVEVQENNLFKWLKVHVEEQAYPHHPAFLIRNKIRKADGYRYYP